LKLFKASGDSMENTIEDGNILLVDTSRTDYHNGGIYVLTINNDWFVKRLRLKINGDLEIISDNPKYDPEILKPNTDIEINVVGRVIKNLSRGL
jgi:phage repressor protein C with HTH and peptisase S24 domain